MKKIELSQINGIPHRANCKLVRCGSRNFLIGGITAQNITNDIYEFRINKNQEQLKLQWKKIQLKKEVFTPRNSFSVCAANNKIYIWGGLELNGHQQKCLSDLIEFDIGKRYCYLEKHTLTKLNIKQSFPIHSSILVYNQKNNQLIGYGGTNEQANQECLLYRLNLSDSTLQWKKKRIQCKEHQGLLWQHSGHILSHSLLREQKGLFLIVVGGCRQPQAPYNWIVEINIQQGSVSGQIQIDTGLVSQQSLMSKDILYIFGGSNGGDFNQFIYKIQNGKLQKIDGHKSIGGACLEMEQGLLVYGGVSGVQSFNGVILYA